MFYSLSELGGYIFMEVKNEFISHEQFGFVKIDERKYVTDESESYVRNLMQNLGYAECV